MEGDSEYDAESRSSFKLVRNAKGDVQIEIKCYALGPLETDETAARERLAAHFAALQEQFPS